MGMMRGVRVSPISNVYDSTIEINGNASASTFPLFVLLYSVEEKVVAGHVSVDKSVITNKKQVKYG